MNGCCNLEIKQLSDCTFSIKIDGVEVSNYLTEFSFNLKAGKVPTFKMTLLTDTVNLHTSASAEIPEPYASMMEMEIEDRLKKEMP